MCNRTSFVRSLSVGNTPVSGCAEGTYARSVRRARHDLRRPDWHRNARQVRAEAQPVAAERFEKAPKAPHRSGSEVSSRQAGIGESETGAGAVLTHRAKSYV